MYCPICGEVIQSGSGWIYCKECKGLVIPDEVRDDKDYKTERNAWIKSLSYSGKEG